MSRFVLMGVSGCGKSTVGQALAPRCGLTLIDGDDLHPRANIVKMSRGEPLSDADREPWLTDVGCALAQASGPAALACSALKRRYRDIIRDAAAGPVHFLHLAAPREVLQPRVNAREGHFMPPALLESQYAALEAPSDDELSTEIDISKHFEDVVNQCEAYVRSIL